MNNVTANVSEAEHVQNSLKLTWTNILTGTILYSIVLLTTLGNILVLVAIHVNKKLHTTFNYYVVNLAITDLAVAVTAMSFHTTDNMLGYWPFGELLCGVWIFFDYGMTFVSVFTLILISLDRFWSVTWITHYRCHHSKKKSIIAILFIWLFMLALWLPPCIYDRLHNAKPGECIWEPSLNKEFVIVIAAIGHHGSCLVMMFCYIKVFIFMRKHRCPLSILASQCAPGMYTSEVSALEFSVDALEGGQSAVLNTPVFVGPRLHQDKDEFAQKNTSDQEISVSYDGLEASASQQNCSNAHDKLPKTSFKSAALRRQKRERAIFVTLTYIIIGYAICWVPFHVVFDISALCPSCVPRGVFAVTFWMTYINSAINPFLYNFSTPEFRQTFRRLLCRK